MAGRPVDDRMVVWEGERASQRVDRSSGGRTHWVADGQEWGGRLAGYLAGVAGSRGYADVRSAGGRSGAGERAAQ